MITVVDNPQKIGPFGNAVGKDYFCSHNEKINQTTSPCSDIGQYSLSAYLLRHFRQVHGGRGRQVYFSKGNLWANATDPEHPVFNFETDQNDFPDSRNTSHAGHFYWSKDASVAYAEKYSDKGTYTDVFFTNTTTETAKSDFTVNGVTGKYRILSSDEWNYLFKYHFHKWVTINSVDGCVIAPYGVELPHGNSGRDHGCAVRLVRECL